MPFPRVLSIPERHAYVQAALPPAHVIARETNEAEALGWTLHPAFDPAWLLANRASVDIIHLHFGFEDVAPEHLQRWVDTLAESGIPLVFTAHDLRNPHQSDPAPHELQLRILLRHAAAVITLTPGAAKELLLRFRVPASVIRHPRVIDPQPRRRSHRSPTVGITFKARANIVSPASTVRAVLRGAEPTGATVAVDAHPRWLPALADLGTDVRLILRPLTRSDDRTFAEQLAALDVSVLPYRFGTHSGWLEACRDLGTRVVAPDCGFYAEQWDEVLSYSHDERWGLDEDSLAVAVNAALTLPPLEPADPEIRAREIEESREQHLRIYLDALT